MNLQAARAVADAVLFEGYLLYPYRATSRKNQVRWQFGVLGPPGAADGGLGEPSSMSSQCIMTCAPGARVTLHLRFLQLQARLVERADDGGYTSVESLTAGTRSWLSWDEAVEHEVELGPFWLSAVDGERIAPVEVAGGEEIETLLGDDGVEVGRIIRRRWPVAASVHVQSDYADGVDGVVRLTVTVESAASTAVDKDDAVRHSLIGTHVLVQAEDAAFVSLLEPPDEAQAAVKDCVQHRCWPVLMGTEGDSDLVLMSPIILYDYPQVADESAGALFDSTEIDEILTLRIMTLTEDEKAEARATDPRAAEIIDRCDAMSPESLAQLHGILRNPHAASLGGAAQAGPELGALGDIRNVEPPSFDVGDVPWWDPAVDEAVQPEVDSVMVDGVPVAKGTLVRLRPSRRADAQDLFFAGQDARVSAVHSDVDGNIHVAVVLVDDPAAEFHEWYGRFLYFAPEEVEPLTDHGQPARRDREESRS